MTNGRYLCLRAPDWRAPVAGGVVSSKLSKLLNQENALSAPCIRCDFCSPQAPSRGTGTLRTGVICRFRCHITVCDHRAIAPTSADAFPVVGGRCTGRVRRCKAKQGRRGKTALTCGYFTHKVVRFLARVQSKSFPMQDEPEGRPCFQHKMSLKGLGMLRIEHQ